MSDIMSDIKNEKKDFLYNRILLIEKYRPLHITITKITRTSPGCPAQWDAFESTGHMVYIRYRYGNLSMYISPEPTDDIYDAVDGQEIFEYKNGGEYDGFMEYSELKKIISRNTKIKLPKFEWNSRDDF